MNRTSSIKIKIKSFGFITFLAFLTIFLSPISIAANNSIVWQEEAEFTYEIQDGSANVPTLGELNENVTFKMILGGTSDIYTETSWDELKVRFKKISPEPVGEATELIRPYLGSNVPDSAESPEDIQPPFFVWLLNESVRSKDGEVHEYFDDFKFNGAKYDDKQGNLIYYNGSQCNAPGLGNIVIKLKEKTVLEWFFALPWYLQLLIEGALTGLGTLLVREIYLRIKNRKE